MSHFTIFRTFYCYKHTATNHTYSLPTLRQLWSYLTRTHLTPGKLCYFPLQNACWVSKQRLFAVCSGISITSDVWQPRYAATFGCMFANFTKIVCLYFYNNNKCLMTLCLGQPGWATEPVPESSWQEHAIYAIMPHRWQAPGESRWYKDYKTANPIQAQNNAGPFQQWLEWILPYFCFWSDRVRLTEASTVMIQLDDNSQDIYYCHHFYARCTSYCKSPNLSWLEIGTELCWTANPMTLFAGMYYKSCFRSHCTTFTPTTYHWKAHCKHRQTWEIAHAHERQKLNDIVRQKVSKFISNMPTLLNHWLDTGYCTTDLQICEVRQCKRVQHEIPSLPVFTLKLIQSNYNKSLRATQTIHTVAVQLVKHTLHS